MPSRRLHPLRSAIAALRLLALGRLRQPRRRVGTRLTSENGQRFVVYRETTVTPLADGATDPGAVLIFEFHLRFMPEPVAPYAVRAFEPLSVLTTPFFVGLPGFRTKLWCFDHDTGDYAGGYEWASAADAERYARALTRLMRALSVPGSVSAVIHSDTDLDEYVAERTVIESGSADAPAATDATGSA